MLLGLAAAGVVAACVLEVREFPRGDVLERVVLAERSFALHYTHSVTRRLIESRYEIRNGRIVQTAELFDEHGPGMATEPLPGERLDTARDAAGVRFVMTMRRPIERLIVRVQRLPAQQLVVRGQVLDLVRLGERAIELKPDCETGTAR